ncbi:MFS transporter [Arenibaculum pallidiluteum]|uniref:MFS transporter n=1 Tax=Arenibaculum pallidiluteum TaxID=2812559 RepID=UPI001A956D9C|nr:MFS transporter [Arenibaculum pallidiluteum]
MAHREAIASPWLVLGLVVAGTLLGIMGTDLVLPAVPSLPETLGGDAARAQLVLAAYVAGTCLGLLVYGALGDRFATRALLVVSLLGTASVSLACAAVDDIDALVALRALQGAVAAGPAVFAPGIVRASFDEARAVRALGLLGSVEALAPALAPLLGVWLLTFGDWRLTFWTIGILALVLAAVIRSSGEVPQAARRPRGSYARLVADPVFLRYALSQAFALGGLLTFVFGMPAVFVRALGGDLADFVLLQGCGIAAFMLAANLAGAAAARFGAERVIALGTGLAAAGAAAMLGYALMGGTAGPAIAALFVPVNIGFGLRGPPGFFRAVVAARGDDARGAALVILAILGSAAAGTVVAAPFIEQGLAPLAAVALGLHLLAVLCLATLPRDGACSLS